jgi:hypothetical protein
MPWRHVQRVDIKVVNEVKEVKCITKRSSKRATIKVEMVPKSLSLDPLTGLQELGGCGRREIRVGSRS